jgi:hypothetical protein
MLVLKDSRSILSNSFSKKAILVSELSSSRQNVYAITLFLRFLKQDYESIYFQRLYFRIICIDYAWASTHAILEVLNLDDIFSYSKRIFRMAQQEKFEPGERTWIVSCVSHTMHRFSRGMKQLFKDKTYLNKKELCFLSFSLLLNSVSLESIQIIWTNIVVFFLSFKRHEKFENAYDNLREFIKERPREMCEELENVSLIS